MAYAPGAVERAMKVQEVMLRTLAGEFTWIQAAEILGLSPRTVHRAGAWSATASNTSGWAGSQLPPDALAGPVAAYASASRGGRLLNAASRRSSPRTVIGVWRIAPSRNILAPPCPMVP